MQTEHLPNMQAKMVDLTGGLVQHRQDLQSTVDTAMNGFKENAKSAEMVSWPATHNGGEAWS